MSSLATKAHLIGLSHPRTVAREAGSVKYIIAHIRVLDFKISQLSVRAARLGSCPGESLPMDTLYDYHRRSYAERFDRFHLIDKYGEVKDWE